MGFEAEPLRFERQGASPGEGVVKRRQPVAVEELRRTWMARVRGAGPPPALPDLGPRRSSTASLVVFSHRTSSLRISNRRSRSSCAATAARVGSGSVNAASSDCPSNNARLASCSASRFFSSRFAARILFASDSSTSTYSDGSSTIWAKMTARAAASGLRAHHRCRVLG